MQAAAFSPPSESPVSYRMTEEKYLAFEQASAVKHEYYDGKVIAMAGANERHELVAGNVFAALHAHLKGKRCRVFKSDMKLRVVGNNERPIFYYPDIMVTCSAKDKHPYYKEQPTLLIEVASSNWQHDYHEKLAVYLTIPTLKEYVIVWPEPRQASVTIYRPETGLKPASVIKRKGSFTLDSVELTMDMADVLAR